MACTRIAFPPYDGPACHDNERLPRKSKQHPQSTLTGQSYGNCRSAVTRLKYRKGTRCFRRIRHGPLCVEGQRIPPGLRWRRSFFADGAALEQALNREGGKSLSACGVRETIQVVHD